MKEEKDVIVEARMEWFFDFVTKNPGCDVEQVAKQFPGLNADQVGFALGRMVKDGMIRWSRQASGYVTTD